MTITDFLHARITEDEQTAQAGISNQADPENGWGYEGKTLTPHIGTIHEQAQAEHIIRWHPTRVLAECAAKRAIIEAADTYLDEYENEEHRTNDDTTAGRVAGRARSWRNDTLRTLAAIYNDHPDYSTAWRFD